jgi:phosphoglycolate phosphatase
MAKHVGPVNGILFDKDGTLFDFHATWGAWSAGFLEAEAGGDPVLKAELARIIGYDLDQMRFRPESVVIANTAEVVADLILPVLPPQSKAVLIDRMNARAATAPQIEAAPLRPLLEGFRARGLCLGVATNDAEAPARAHLATAGVTGLFDFIAGFDSGHGSKPAPGQLLAFAHAFDLDPRTCVMVGDSLHDLHAARAAGMLAVAVLTGVATHDDLVGAADVVLPSIADLPDWLGH